MKKLTAAIVGFLLAVTAARAQPPTTFYTRPTLPPPEVLDRLNLKVGWSNTVPVDVKRDGIFDIRLADDQILVQTRSGLVVALDRETGQTQWRARLGRPYEPLLPLAYNAVAVFVASGNEVYALNRKTGQLQWQLGLAKLPTAPPGADEQHFYLGMDNQFYSYQLPKMSSAPIVPRGVQREGLPSPAGAPRPAAPAPVAGAGKAESALLPKEERPGDAGYVPPDAPFQLWDARFAGRLDYAPLIIDQYVTVLDSLGNFVTHSKLERFLFGFPLETPLASPPATAPEKLGETAYVVLKDYTVHAIDLVTSRQFWRYVSGGPILMKPAATDDSLYVVVEGEGLHRLDRATGADLWRRPNVSAVRFLAENSKFAYALDRSGRLLILDRTRGTELTRYDIRDFVVPVENTLTDRLLLAAHNGYVVSLHDKDYPTPLVYRKPPQPPQPPAGDAKPAEKQPEDKDKKENP